MEAVNTLAVAEELAQVGTNDASTSKWLSGARGAAAAAAVTAVREGGAGWVGGAAMHTLVQSFSPAALAMGSPTKGGHVSLLLSQTIPPCILYEVHF